MPEQDTLVNLRDWDGFDNSVIILYIMGQLRQPCTVNFPIPNISIRRL
jgi:hypothetical protein